MAWTPLLAAADLPPGAVAGVTVDGRPLVVWRTATGRVAAGDARCPHQWSPLDLEGVVEGEELVCPSHDWRFAPDGTGWKCNLAGRRDRKGDLAVLEVRERDGVVEAQL